MVKGELTSLAPAADLRTQTFKGEIRIANEDRDIKPGMFAEVELKSVAADNVVVVPSRAILQRGSHYLAYVICDDVASVREVSVGMIGEDFIEVKSGGLNEGDVVAVKGAALFKRWYPPGYSGDRR